jgi:hypothetical protein
VRQVATACALPRSGLGIATVGSTRRRPARSRAERMAISVVCRSMRLAPRSRNTTRKNWFYFAPDLLSERFDRFFLAPFPSPAREAANGKSPRRFPEIAHLTDLWPAPMVRGSYGAYCTRQPEPDQRGRKPGGFINLLLYAQSTQQGCFMMSLRKTTISTMTRTESLRPAQDGCVHRAGLDRRREVARGATRTATSWTASCGYPLCEEGEGLGLRLSLV